MPKSESEFFKGKRGWLVFAIFIWMPMELLFLFGADLSCSATLNAATVLLQKVLATRLLEFRSILSPEIVLTNQLDEARSKAAGSSSPEEWHGLASSSLKDLPARSFDLFLTDGRRVIPDTPGFDPESLSAFLASMTARSDSLKSSRTFFHHLRATTKEIDSIGNSRFSRWKFINLPTPPGIPNQAFDRNWRAHHISFIINSPRNTWAAFGEPSAKLDGSLKTSPSGRKRHPCGPPTSTSVWNGWRYLIVFHRQYLKETDLRKLSLKVALGKGLRVAGTNPDLSPFDGENSALMNPEKVPISRGEIKPGLERIGRCVFFTEFHERLGFLTAFGFLSARLWLLPILSVFASLAFSFAILLFSLRWVQGAGPDLLHARGKIFLGFTVAAGLPLFLALPGIEGAVGAHIFQSIQREQMEMEKAVKALEGSYDRFIDRVSMDYRGVKKSLPVAWDPASGLKAGEKMVGIHQAAALHLFTSEGRNVMSLGPYSWSVYRVSLRNNLWKEAYLQERSGDGMFLFPFEMDMLEKGNSSTPAASDKDLRRILFANGRNSDKLLQLKLFESFARVVCQATNREEGVVKPEDEKTGVLLSLALKGRENEFVSEALSSLGLLANFKMAGYHGLSYFDVLRDRYGKARMFLMIFHRLSNISQQFLVQAFKKGNPDARFGISAIALEPGKTDFGEAIDSGFQRPVRLVLGGSEKGTACILPDASGTPKLVSIGRSKKMDNFLLAASIPLERFRVTALELQRKYLVALGLIFLLITGVIGWLSRILLKPLREMQTCVSEMSHGNYGTNKIEPGIGEMGILANVFNQTIDDLRQMSLARTIQEKLLPSGPFSSPKFHIQGASEMMSQVGGDYFDMIPCGKDRLLVIIGDVSGHGMPAAIIVAMVKSGLTVLSRETLGLHEMFGIITEIMLKMLSRKKLMTCFGGILDKETGLFSYSNAGHNFPLLVPANGECKYIKQPNFPLGAMKNRPYKLESLILNPQDMLILFTDGIIEAQNPEGKILGYERFQEFIRNILPCSPEKIIERVFCLVKDYTQGSPKQDDISILIICRKF